MTKQKKESYFWTSYSDLMTSMFFVMLVLFVLTTALIRKKMVVTQNQIDKIREIQNAFNNIDTTYFQYNTIYKKHILKTKVNFMTGVSDIYTLDLDTRIELINAGKSIRKLLNRISIDYPGIQYLLIIEGQASKDNYYRNNELSYERALSLKDFWDRNGVYFGDNCEVIISGSGTGGSLRDSIEKNNQRFLIHIIAKPGMIQ
ncbi:MAG TPA: hypothetical protein PLK41_06980 [Defluviitoga tunisiensis]|nr:hypothetical protein [Defluviitoga tunisiensis]HPP10714.1 hypothetical protein [Defluviitoga tunisiensis]